MFVFSFLTCFLLVFLSFCSDSSSSFLCVPFNSKSFLFWSPAAASVFSSASQRAAQTDAALSLFFISVFFLFLFKALTPQSAAAACQQTRLRPIPTAQRRPLNLKKRKEEMETSNRSAANKPRPPSSHISHVAALSWSRPELRFSKGKNLLLPPPTDRSIERHTQTGFYFHHILHITSHTPPPSTLK